MRDAISISRGYLDAQTPELADPEMHRGPRIVALQAVHAGEASGLDGCIPTTPGNRIVWITWGQGDYLNLSDHPWSRRFSVESQIGPDPSRMLCEAPAQTGTLVIDDATGTILGVYPGDHGAVTPAGADSTENTKALPPPIQ